MPIPYNFFPLGVIRPTPGTPVDIFENFPALRLEEPSFYGNMVLFQAYHDNAGKAFVGSEELDVVTDYGLYYTLMGAGDSFSVGTTGALNIFHLKQFRIDVETLGDGVIVSMFQR